MKKSSLKAHKHMLQPAIHQFTVNVTFFCVLCKLENTANVYSQISPPHWIILSFTVIIIATSFDFVCASLIPLSIHLSQRQITGLAATQTHTAPWTRAIYAPWRHSSHCMSIIGFQAAQNRWLSIFCSCLSFSFQRRPSSIQNKERDDGIN